MPATLNALIRYKTINSCLYGGRRKWSIRELIDACSTALADARGRYEPISERTIRDDIRVMRSDILGFNAPITQEKGLYYYSDPQYSIFTLVITDPDLAGRIHSFLVQIRDQIGHPELESILDLLSKLAVKPVIRQRVPHEQISRRISQINENRVMDETEARDTDQIISAELFNISYQAYHVPQMEEVNLSWGLVFEKILSPLTPDLLTP